MTPSLTPPGEIRAAVDAFLQRYLDAESAAMTRLGDSGGELLEAMRPMLAKGKRTRAGLCWWGYELGIKGRAEASDPEGIVAAAAAIELFHAAALVHDDIIDHSESRRGEATTHVALSRWHSARSLEGDPQEFGRSAAIIGGDLCLGMSEDLFGRCRLAPHSARVRELRRELRRDVMVGQYLDVRAQATPATPATMRKQAWDVLTLKTAKYSVQQPLVMGAALAEADEPVLDALAALGLPLGQAYQLRDDLLGVFGDPAVTGKPAGDDLREGKRTLLLGYALGDAPADEAGELEAGVGDAGADVARLRAIITASGAPARIESDIDTLVQQAYAAQRAVLEAGADPRQVDAFRAFADALVARSS